MARKHHNEFSAAQLLEIAQFQGFRADALKQAKIDWFDDRQDVELRQSFGQKQRRSFKSHLITYVMVNAFLVVLFGVGRLLFLRGYRRDQRGAKGRAFGMTLTMLPTLAGYLLAIALIATPA